MGNIPSVNLKSEYFQVKAGNLASLEEKKTGIRFSRSYLIQIQKDISEMSFTEVSSLADYYVYINISNLNWIRNYISMPIDQNLSGYKLTSSLGNFALIYLNIIDKALKDLALERYEKLLTFL
jgi:hypothetical protein